MTYSTVQAVYSGYIRVGVVRPYMCYVTYCTFDLSSMSATMANLNFREPLVANWETRERKRVNNEDFTNYSI